jgi:carbon storage regulator
MLVLSRKQGEAIHVGNHITITVLGVRGGTVKLGIEAPANVRILRGELPNWAEDLPTGNEQPSLVGETLAV